MVRARPIAQKNTCIAQLKQLDGAKRQWAIDQEASVGSLVTWSDIIGTNAYIKIQPTCPLSGAYKLGGLTENPSCSLAHSDGHSL